VDLKNLNDVINLYYKTQPDYIINCAAHVGSLNYVTQHASDVYIDNLKIAINIYEALIITKISPIIINPIANCAYPANSDTYVEDDWLNGGVHRSVFSYGNSRRNLWAISECFQMQYNIKTISLFVPNMYGEFDSTDPNKAHALNALISKFVKAQKDNTTKIEIWGTGSAIREWLYAKDFAKIILLIINSNKNLYGLNEPINIAQNFGLSVRELVHIINKNFNYTGEIKWDFKMPDGAPKKVMDDRKFKKVFNNFNFTDFNEGIKNTIKYYEKIFPY
jgi:GDP-L-fucose synthase